MPLVLSRIIAAITGLAILAAEFGFLAPRLALALSYHRRMDAEMAAVIGAIALLNMVAVVLSLGCLRFASRGRILVPSPSNQRLVLFRIIAAITGLIILAIQLKLFAPELARALSSHRPLSAEMVTLFVFNIVALILSLACLRFASRGRAPVPSPSDQNKS
jgi:hypothetical protein